MRRWPRVLLGAGALDVMGGVAVLLSRSGRQASFGWFAYEPLAPDALDSFVAVNTARVAGAGLVVGGLVLVVGTLGFLGGARRPTGDTRDPLVGAVVVAALAVVVGLVGLALTRCFVALDAQIETNAWTTAQLGDAALAVGGLLALVLLAGIRLGRRRT